MKTGKTAVLLMAALLSSSRAWAEDVRLDYLQGDGTAYIDTEYTLTAADVVEIEFMVQDTELTHIFGVCGDGSSSDNRVSLSVVQTGGAPHLVADYCKMDFSGRLKVLATDISGLRAKARIWAGGRFVSLFGKPASWENTDPVTDGGSVKATRSCHLFRINGSGPQPFKGRIYSFKILHGGEVALDLLPYRRDGVCGFKDQKSGDFFTSSVGQLTGPELGYRAKYIQGDGVAYLMTGIWLKAGDRVDAEFMPQNGTAAAYLFGSRESADKRNFSAMIAQSLGKQQLLVDYLSYAYRFYVPLSDLLNNRVKLSVSKDLRSVSVEESGKTWTDPTPLSGDYFSTPGKCYVFYANGNNLTSGGMFDGRLYSFSIVREGVKIADLVPWKRGNEAGMRDLVSWEFYGNAADSGAFTAKGVFQPGLMLILR